MSELLCTELSAIPAISTRLHDDQRRLGTYLEQEERFMPSTYHMQKTVEEEQRQRMLEIIHEAVSQEPRKSDVYHLAVNLLDRYLSYETVESEREFLAVSGASAMISMKIRRARKECLNYDQLRYHFSISERSIRLKEKEIATKLKWNLNAVTAADFIEELSRRVAHLLPAGILDKLVDQSHTLANICLLYHSFMCVPPSLLACACLCDAIDHIAPAQLIKCMEMLAQLAGLDQDVLSQQQKNVSKVFLEKLQSSTAEDANSPTDIADIDTQFNFTETYPENLS